MARAPITPMTSPNLKALPLTAASADMAYAACDATNFNQCRHSGRVALFAKNSDSAPHSVTVTSVKDSLGRSGDMTYSVGATTESFLGVFPYEGWCQADGNLYFGSTASQISFLAIALP